ncbi:MAG: DinB family protein [Acidobacteria bacterium]|nr:DinB family protein [Acidobacteriota bacterium]
MRESLLADLDHELAATRHVMERAPQASLEWRPHERSFSLGGLVTHLASLPRWGQQILDQPGYDLAGVEAGTRRAPAVSVQEALATFDGNVANVRRSLVAMTDGELHAPWTLRRGDQVLLSTPRFSALRHYLLHHVIHHRGQLTVYLRLLGVPLPPLYGPTADES